MEPRDPTNEHLYDTIVSNPNMLIWAIDKEGIITVSEGAGLKLLGVKPGELVGANVFELYARTPELLPYMRRALAGETLDYSIEMLGIDGKLTLDNRLRPQFSDEGEVIGVSAITFEVTDRVELEKKVRRAETMEAIGMVVGGIAHDFNNLLTAIIGFASVARRAEADKRDEYLDHVAEAADRGAALVRQLLSFARKDEVRPEFVDLLELVQSNMPLYRQLTGEDIQIRIEIADETQSHVHMDRSKLEQVFLNLVANARDAMPKGGDLHLRLSQGESSNNESWLHVEISDTGIGMDEVTQQCIFDPFFSTKKRGSGLGLATSHSIISRAGGSLDVVSAPDEGATFHLRLRAYKTECAASPAEEASKSVAQVGRVLLIDDDEAVLQATALTLQAAGYALRTAQSGQAGYNLFTASDEHFDIIVTDMTMPGMKGDELAQLIRKTDTAIPIVCVSGYHGHSAGLSQLPRVSVLSKPYGKDELASLIAKLLQQP